PAYIGSGAATTTTPPAAGSGAPSRDAQRSQFEVQSVVSTSVRVADATPEEIPDDRADVQPGDPTLLVIDDDQQYGRVLADLARDKGFKVLVAQRGADALELARESRPTAISLDVFLPDMLGWTVLSHLKRDPNLRHIPVQIITLDESRQEGLSRG